MDLRTATFMFYVFEHKFSDDPELLRSLVKAVLSYGHQHIDQDLSHVIDHTSNIVSRCPDYATQSALQWALVMLAAKWEHSYVLTSHRDRPWQLSKIRRNTVDMLSRNPEDFIHYPRRLHHLPHIAALAALLKASFVGSYGSITWPISSYPGIRSYTKDRLSDAHPEWEPMVREIFKISVCSVERDSPARPSEHTSGMRDRIAQETLHPPAAATAGASETPPAEATGAEAALARDAAERASRQSHESTLSTANLLGPEGVSRGHDAHHAPLKSELARSVDAASTRTLEVVIVHTDRDAARTSADTALLGSHDAEEAGSQDSRGGPTLARSDQEGADSMAIRRTGDTGVRAGRGALEVKAGPPHASSGPRPPQTSGSPADAEEAGSQDAAGGGTLAHSEPEGGYSMDAQHIDGTGVLEVRDPPEVDAGPPHASSGRMPPKTSGSPADPPSQRRRDPLAVALPREATVNARARETKRTDGQGEQAGARDQMPDDSRTDTATQAYRSVVMHTTTPLPDDSSDRPASAIAVNDEEVLPLADETVSGGGDEAVYSVLVDAGGFVPHARDRSIPPESREMPHTSVAEESRAVNAPSPDEGHARTVSSGAAGWETQHRESAREADAKAEPATESADEPSALASLLPEHSGLTLVDTAIPLPSHADAGVSADAAGSHPDGKSGVEGSRECANEIAGGGGIPGA